MKKVLCALLLFLGALVQAGTILPGGVKSETLLHATIGTIVAGPSATAIVTGNRGVTQVINTVVVSGSTLTLGPYDYDLSLTINSIGDSTTYSSAATPTNYGGAPTSYVFDVRNYGARCDGVTDDHVAYQNASNAALAASYVSGSSLSATIRLCQSGQSLLSTGWNLTGFTSFGAPNALAVTIDGNGSSLICQTRGTPCVDALGSRFINFKNLSLYGSSSNPSSIGLQIGRSGTNSADQFFFDRPVIQGTFTFAALYDEASETDTFIQPWLTNVYAPNNATISGISKASSAVVTASDTSQPFALGQELQISGVSGMTQMNGLAGIVTAVGGSSGAWTATINVNSSGFSTYTSGGTATISSYALVLDGYNHFNVKSAFTSVTAGVDTAESFNDTGVYGGWIGGGTRTLPVWLGNVSHTRFDAAYVEGAGAADFVLYNEGSNVSSGLWIDVHTETTAVPYTFLATGKGYSSGFNWILHGFTYYDHSPQATTALLHLDTSSGATGAVLTDSNIRVDYFYSVGATVFDTPANWQYAGFMHVPAAAWAMPNLESGAVCLDGLCVNYWQLPSYPISQLPSCGSSNAGQQAYVTNGQTSPSYLGAVSTTGSTKAPVICLGSWVYH